MSVKIEYTAKGYPVIAASLGSHKVGDVVTATVLTTPRPGEFARETVTYRVKSVGKEFLQRVYLDEEDARSFAGAKAGWSQQRIAYHYLERV